MNPFDDALLDDPARIDRADTGGLLRALAGAGAQVRRAARAAAESGLPRLRPGDRPRAVLLAAEPACGPLGDAVRALTAPVAILPVLDLDPAALPGWAGPLDLVVPAGRGDERALVTLVEQAARRGCQIAAVTPAGTPLGDAALQARGLTVPVPVRGVHGSGGAAEGAAPLAFWPLLVGLLAVARACGLGPQDTDDDAEALADRLDDIGTRCRPGAPTSDNPAKSLAARLAGGLPLAWGAGPLAGVAAERFARMCAAVAAIPALHGTLPGALALQGRLVHGGPGGAGGDLDDFFRDRIDEPEPLRIAPLLLTDRDDAAATRLAAGARRIAEAAGPPPAAVDATGGTPLTRFGELIAVTDFTAGYLALATGADTAASVPYAPHTFDGNRDEGGPR